jgi:hypothetical protein
MTDAIESSTLEDTVSHFASKLLHDGRPVDTGHWQAIKDVPQVKTIELRNEVLVTTIEPRVETWHEFCNPSTPWAEDHFQERVGGEPLNPGEQYKNWPWYKGNVTQHQTVIKPEDTERKFSHTYMERYWPKHANRTASRMNAGIRYTYGDLNDLVDLLVREPYTRQAFLPVWFPEDTGAVHDQRVPCSLGYHFLLREGALHCNYYIRSCDLLRHFRDDVYLTGRLCQWVVEKCRFRTVSEGDQWWQGIMPGELTMIMSSLHIFEGDLPKLRREYGG